MLVWKNALPRFSTPAYSLPGAAEPLEHPARKGEDVEKIRHPLKLAELLYIASGDWARAK